MSGRVLVDSKKWGGRQHYRYDTTRLGGDEHGVWLGAPKGTPVVAADGRVLPATSAFVKLIPVARMWCASFNLDGDPAIYADVTTHSVWHGDRVEMADLDLDVILRADGTVHVDDEDEFAEHTVAFGYPPELVAAARASADWLVAAITAGEEPFATAGRRWLDRLRDTLG